MNTDRIYSKTLACQRDAGEVMINGDQTYVDADLFISFDRYGYRSGFGASRVGTYRMSLIARNDAIRALFSVPMPDLYAVVDDFGTLVMVGPLQ